MASTSLTEHLDALLARLREANADTARRYPGETDRRQPVHTVYGGAHLFRSDTTQKLASVALQVLDEYAPDPDTLARAVGLEEAALAARVHRRVREKLAREAVEDFRIDFEDGYGTRSDQEEDGHAVSVGREVAAGLSRGTLPRSIGIRIKPLSDELARRSLRTLDLFVEAMTEASNGSLPPLFVVTLPKITSPPQVAALADALRAIETAHGLSAGAISMEVMIETTQSVFAADGSVALPALIALGQGRITGAHFGTYDYTASIGITAAHQTMTHPACDFAKRVMQVALAGTGVTLSDGATNIMPVGPHRAVGGATLTAAQRRENRAAVHAAWKTHFDHITHSLVGGFYQGWDLHPAQLPTRYAAVFAFFLQNLPAASERLRNFVRKAAQATLIGDVFDDAATGQGLLNYFLRALNSGAIGEDEAVEMSGLTLDELRGRSFVKILDNRRRR
jgi:citrate lyase beta subunit